MRAKFTRYKGEKEATGAFRKRGPFLNMAGEVEDFAEVVKGIVSFQALFRGYRTRKAIAPTRKEFIAIFNEIEGEFKDRFDVQWKSTIISRPSIKPFETNASISFARSNKSGENKIGGKSLSSNKSREERDFTASEKDELTTTERDLSPTSATTISEDGDVEPEKRGTDQPLDPRLKAESSKDCINTEDSFSDSILYPGLSNSANDNQRHDLTKGMESSDVNRDTIWLSVALEKLKSMRKEDVVAKRKEIRMELMWIQQAIESRKQYIKLKG